jgi:hypothetical protein
MRTSGRVILSILFIFLCFFVGFVINGIAINIISPTTLEEIENPVYTNPVTNQYYLINSEGDLVDVENYKVSPDVNKPKGIERKIKYDMNIWGISETDTEYYILIPLERE